MNKKTMKYDLTVVIGIIIGWSCVILCLVLEGNKLSAFLSLSSFLLVFGGSLGATIVGIKLNELLSIWRVVIDVFTPPKLDFDEAITEMRDLAMQARRGGVLSLEERINLQRDDFIKTGLQLVVDGADSEVVQKILDTKAILMETRNKTGEKFFEAMGGYAPTLGIIGTVLGLVKVLGNLSEPEKLGEGIAQAFVATLYGISTANLLFLPLAVKIKANASRESLYYEMIQEGILSIHAGDNPVMVEEKLRAFVMDKIPEQGIRTVQSEEEVGSEEGSATA